MSGWLLGLAIALLVVHLARPRFLRRNLSAARFFVDLPPARKGQPKWALANPIRSRPLLFHLPILLLLGTIVLFPNLTLSGVAREGFGVWILIDSSGSMNTEDEGQTRHQRALQEAHSALETIAASGSGTTCVRLSSFDQERVDISESQSLSAIHAALNGLTTRALGSDLNLVRTLLASLAAQPTSECPITHVLVFSDLPAPAWPQNEAVQLIWRQVGKPRGNLGFTQIEASRDPLSGLIHKVQLSVTAYGQVPPSVTLKVLDPNHQEILNQPLSWTEDQSWYGSLAPQKPGTYLLQLDPGGAWSLDDTAEIVIGTEDQVRVDWRLPEKAWPLRLGWSQTVARAHLAVASAPIGPSSLPTLWVGPGYQSAGPAQEIRDFQESSPILADINLDALERLGLRGMDLPPGFEPVLRLADGSVLVASAADPPAVLVPGLPTVGDSNLAHVSSTLFFNSVRHLMDARPLDPIFELTDPAHPEPGPGRLAIHEGEGNSARPLGPSGSLSALHPVPLPGEGTPIWPYLLLLAVALLLLERGLAVYGGESWV